LAFTEKRAGLITTYLTNSSSERFPPLNLHNGLGYDLLNDILRFNIVLAL